MENSSVNDDPFQGLGKDVGSEVGGDLGALAGGGRRGRRR